MRADLLVKKLLAENYIGRPHHVRLQSFTGAYLDSDAPAHWRQRIEISGLNVLTLGIYVEVLNRWLGDIIPDLVTVLCSFENGAEGVLEFSGVNAHASSDRAEIYGDRGTLTYDFATDIVQAGKVGDKALRVIDLTPELESEWRVEEDFLAAVKSKGRIRPHPSFEDGVRYMRVVQAVADSRARNEWVAIKK